MKARNAEKPSVNRPAHGPANTKSPSTPKTKPAATPSPIRILKIALCPSMSGQSTPTYHVGADRGEILLRVHGNTGGGQFNPDWVPSSALLDRLREYPKDRRMSAAALRPLFKNRAVNTPAFLFAVLIAEGLVTREGHGYAIGDPEPFLKAVQALADSKVDLSAEIIPQSATG